MKFRKVLTVVSILIMLFCLSTAFNAFAGVGDPYNAPLTDIGGWFYKRSLGKVIVDSYKYQINGRPWTAD